jgi:hypothetical protein
MNGLRWLILIAQVIASATSKQHSLAVREALPGHRLSSEVSKLETTFGLLVFPPRANECGVRKTTMNNYPYILFNKSPEQLRRLGARGGRAHGCNQRARRAQIPTPLPTAPMRVAPRETTAEAIKVLDAQFPWLRGAETRRSCSQSSH